MPKPNEYKMTTAEKRKKWDEFVAAFKALGDETYGMTPAAAYQLAAAAVEYEADKTKGVRAQKLGAVIWAQGAEYGGPVVRIPEDYFAALGFWNINQNCFNAQVTQDACDYILKHIEVFQLLDGL